MHAPSQALCSHFHPLPVRTRPPPSGLPAPSPPSLSCKHPPPPAAPPVAQKRPQHAHSPSGAWGIPGSDISRHHTRMCPQIPAASLRLQHPDTGRRHTCTCPVTAFLPPSSLARMVRLATSPLSPSPVRHPPPATGSTQGQAQALMQERSTTPQTRPRYACRRLSAAHPAPRQEIAARRCNHSIRRTRRKEALMWPGATQRASTKAAGAPGPLPSPDRAAGNRARHKAPVCCPTVALCYNPDTLLDIRTTWCPCSHSGSSRSGMGKKRSAGEADDRGQGPDGEEDQRQSRSKQEEQPNDSGEEDDSGSGGSGDGDSSDGSSAPDVSDEEGEDPGVRCCALRSVCAARQLVHLATLSPPRRHAPHTTRSPVIPPPRGPQTTRTNSTRSM